MFLNLIFGNTQINSQFLELISSLIKLFFLKRHKQSEKLQIHEDKWCPIEYKRNINSSEYFENNSSNLATKSSILELRVFISVCYNW